MTKSKAWNWNNVSSPQWEEPASEMYSLLKRWQKANFKKILDLGCGIGRHAIFFSKNGFDVGACDLSQEGIDKLNKLIKNKGLNINAEVSDMLSLPYENNSFDGLIAFHVISHTDDKGIDKVLSEIKRVLKLQGEAFITFNSKNSLSFKNPDNKHLSENTVVKTTGFETGIPHFYTNKEGVEKLLVDFEIVEFFYKEEYFQNIDYVGAHYFILVKNK